MKTICLNMIVKNESRVIRRCLDSVRGLVDYWTIVDTGSTDDTEEIIEECLKGIPGNLYQRPWVDFAHNRNEAMQLAGKGDYLLFIDADETLEWEELDKAKLTKNFYAVKNRDLSVDFYRILLIDRNPGWRWEGVLHETIVNSGAVDGEILPNILRVGLPRDGARAKDSERYAKDAEILKAELGKDPLNARTAFYLAQSYGSAGKKEEALKAYRKRAGMSGPFNEQFLSLYYCGCLEEDLGRDRTDIIRSYEKAYRFDPTRAEPLASMARLFLKANLALPAWLLANFGLTHPHPTSAGYVRREVYDYQLSFLAACAAQSLGRKEEANARYSELLSKKELPDEARERVLRNLYL